MSRITTATRPVAQASASGAQGSSADASSAEPRPRLHAGLTKGQVNMMGLGGAIGAGLFVGSGEAIQVAGPGVLISYLVAGALVILIMAALAEMVANDPSAGAFSAFAHKALGRTAGSTIGWLYWIQIVVVIAAEATAAAAIMSQWMPGIPQWAWMLAFMLTFTVVNLQGVKNFGRFEFWFAVLKVLAIVVFLLVGVVAIFGLLPGMQALGFSNLFAHGGFVPNGMTGIAAAVLMVIFAFGGTEVVAIAAAESDNPSQNIKRVMRSVVARIMVLYVGSIVVIVAVLPWNDATVASGPFAAVLGVLNVPGVELVMSIIVVVALLSALNANLYASSRMLFSLGERGLAPRFVTRVSAKGVPFVAVLASVTFGIVTVVFNALWPDVVLPALLNVVGSTLIVLWTFIAVSQLTLRRRAQREGRTLLVQMPGFPWLTLVSLGMIGAIVVATMFDEGTRSQLLLTFALTAVIAVISKLTAPRGSAAVLTPASPVSPTIGAEATADAPAHADTQARVDDANTIPPRT